MLIDLESATPKQICYVLDLMRSCGFTDDDRAAYYLKITGRAILSTGEITKRQASVMIQELKLRYGHIQRGYTPPDLLAETWPPSIPVDGSKSNKLRNSVEDQAQRLADLFRDCDFSLLERKAYLKSKVGREIVFLDDLTEDESSEIATELGRAIKGKIDAFADTGPPPWD